MFLFGCLSPFIVVLWLLTLLYTFCHLVVLDKRDGWVVTAYMASEASVMASLVMRGLV
ncbi:hypothetical protein B0T17DRAFT_527459 [Bombardia bombarda]|uniref:Uncharacterized protein n=1 Tax=Bombardia bombarda TaxID=252184 RepID=A0AA39XB97_9PEZI|nr:hypothetical protein B0T17DRAFT_527459 [Bombardia bombarda]